MRVFWMTSPFRIFPDYKRNGLENKERLAEIDRPPTAYVVHIRLSTLPVQRSMDYSGGLLGRRGSWWVQLCEVMTHFLTAVKSGHWPTLLGAWLHLTISFMVWLLIGALGVLIADTFGLTATEKVTAVAMPLLGGAFLRVIAGWSCDWFGAKRTGVAVLICELIAVLWGWLGIHSYAELMVVGLFLGIGGASFAVALPLAGRAYPLAHQGLALGLAASGNIGTVVIMFFAPRWGATIGWQHVFGVMAVPVLLTLVLFLALVRDDRVRVDASVRRGTNARWWHAAAELMQHRSMYWLCFAYAVTFGGFVGLCSVLPIFFHDQYGMDLVTAGSMTALCGLGGSVIRPLGGYVADRTGGVRTLRLIFPTIVFLTIGIGYLPPIWVAVSLMVLAVGVMGFGNGAVFQLVSERFQKQIGLASGLVGAAGGLGGFLVPIWLGVFKDMTGTYRTGFWVFAVVAALAWITTISIRRRHSSTA
ncbi:MAG: NarK/NasA family nitrate transporter [Nitrospirales bacterium]|nr:NarK/NasA family nitrate transporter [Nitrospirales bacterium]